MPFLSPKQQHQSTEYCRANWHFLKTHQNRYCNSCHNTACQQIYIYQTRSISGSRNAITNQSIQHSRLCYRICIVRRTSRRQQSVRSSRNLPPWSASWHRSLRSTMRLSCQEYSTASVYRPTIRSGNSDHPEICTETTELTNNNVYFTNNFTTTYLTAHDQSTTKWSTGNSVMWPDHAPFWYSFLSTG